MQLNNWILKGNIQDIKELMNYINFHKFTNYKEMHQGYTLQKVLNYAQTCFSCFVLFLKVEKPFI